MKTFWVTIRLPGQSLHYTALAASSIDAWAAAAAAQGDNLCGITVTPAGAQ